MVRSKQAYPQAASIVFLIVAFVAGSASALAQSLPPISHQIEGLHGAYAVQKGDTLRSLSSRHGIPV